MKIDMKSSLFSLWSLWNDIFTWEQDMDETKLYPPIYVDLFLIHKISDT